MTDHTKTDNAMTFREQAEKIVEGCMPVLNYRRRAMLIEAVAALESASKPPNGFVRDEHGVDRKVLGIRWHCGYCDTVYAEYVNGCPRCHFGEHGTSTSVDRVLIISTKSAERAGKGATDGK